MIDSKEKPDSCTLGGIDNSETQSPLQQIGPTRPRSRSSLREEKPFTPPTVFPKYSQVEPVLTQEVLDTVASGVLKKYAPEQVSVLTLPAYFQNTLFSSFSSP